MSFNVSQSFSVFHHLPLPPLRLCTHANKQSQLSQWSDFLKTVLLGRTGWCTLRISKAPVHCLQLIGQTTHCTQANRVTSKIVGTRQHSHYFKGQQIKWVFPECAANELCRKSGPPLCTLQVRFLSLCALKWTVSQKPKWSNTSAKFKVTWFKERHVMASSIYWFHRTITIDMNKPDLIKATLEEAHLCSWPPQRSCAGHAGVLLLSKSD